MPAPQAQRDDASAPFFDSLAGGRLAVQRCGGCGEWIPPGGFNLHPPVRCPVCGGAQLDWTATEGRGTVVSWTIDPRFPSIFDGTSGQTAGIVELTEGPWIIGVFAMADRELAEGLSVRVDGVVPVQGGEAVPVFRPDAEEISP